MLTFPHFLDTSEEYTSLVEGLNPDPELHKTMVILEPVRVLLPTRYRSSHICINIFLISQQNTGNPLVGHKRAQFNMFIRPIPGFESMANIKTALIPILWVDEGILLNEEMITLMRTTLIDRLVLVDVLHWVLFGGGLAIFVVFLIWYLCTRNNGGSNL